MKAAPSEICFPIRNPKSAFRNPEGFGYNLRVGTR